MISFYFCVLSNVEIVRMHLLSIAIFYLFAIFIHITDSSGKMKDSEFAAKVDNLESQIQELTHLVARLLKNQNPTSSTQEPHTSPQADDQSSPSGKSTPEPSSAYPKPPNPSISSTKTRRESKGYWKKAEKEKRAFAPLPDDLFTMCARLVEDKLIARIKTKQRTCIPKGFNPHVHCYYHMDVFGHKIEECWALRHRIQDLIDEGVIIIDIPNQKYEINGRPKAHHASHPDPPRYSPTNPLSSEIPDQVIPELKVTKRSMHTNPRILNRASPSSNQSSS